MKRVTIVNVQMVTSRIFRWTFNSPIITPPTATGAFFIGSSNRSGLANWTINSIDLRFITSHSVGDAWHCEPWLTDLEFCPGQTLTANNGTVL